MQRLCTPHGASTSSRLRASLAHHAPSHQGVSSPRSNVVLSATRKRHNGADGRLARLREADTSSARQVTAPPPAPPRPARPQPAAKLAERGVDVDEAAPERQALSISETVPTPLAQRDAQLAEEPPAAEPDVPAGGGESPLALFSQAAVSDDATPVAAHEPEQPAAEDSDAAAHALSLAPAALAVEPADAPPVLALPPPAPPPLPPPHPPAPRSRAFFTHRTSPAAAVVDEESVQGLRSALGAARDDAARLRTEVASLASAAEAAEALAADAAIAAAAREAGLWEELGKARADAAASLEDALSRAAAEGDSSLISAVEAERAVATAALEASAAASRVAEADAEARGSAAAVHLQDALGSAGGGGTLDAALAVMRETVERLGSAVDAQRSRADAAEAAAEAARRQLASLEADLLAVTELAGVDAAVGSPGWAGFHFTTQQLVGLRAFAKWHAKGEPQQSAAAAAGDYDDAKAQTEKEVATGASSDELFRAFRQEAAPFLVRGDVRPFDGAALALLGRIVDAGAAEAEAVVRAAAAAAKRQKW